MFLSYAFAYLLGFFEGSSQIPVAASLIDAHAGALGMLATKYTSGIRKDISNVLGIIAGTSACHMILNTKPIKITGVWGPYDSAIIDDMWLHEGGQSAVGSLLDNVVETHSAYVDANKEAKINNMSIQEYLFYTLKDIASKSDVDNIAYLTKEIHIWPDFHGNRSPLADPHMKVNVDQN